MAEQTKKPPKQVGVIIFGGGIDKQRAVDDARDQGYEVRVFADHAQLWK